MLTAETIHWADGYLLVYSILDRTSLDYIKRMKRHIIETRHGFSGNNPVNATFLYPCVLLANKADMVHLRQVTTDEGTYKYTCFYSVMSAMNMTPAMDIV